MTPWLSDYDYITRLVQFLEHKFRIRLFITCKDFDVMYNWWEKNIPVHLIQEAIVTVVLRWEKKGKKITGFSNFNYQVRKNFSNFLELEIGESQNISLETEVEAQESFLENFPADLKGLEGLFIKLIEEKKEGRERDLISVDEALLARFAHDPDLNLKTDLFLKNLAPELRKPLIQKRYRLNYLRNKYGIPDFQ